MTSRRREGRHNHASAARHALTLCEAELYSRGRVSAVAARAALRSAGIPPLLAAALRTKLRLTPDREEQR